MFFGTEIARGEMVPRTQTVLLVEAETLVGLTLAIDLEEVGYEVIGPFASCADASTWLAEATPDLAVLDIALKDGDCRPLARELRSRDVPFLLYTVLRRARNMQPEFEGAPWIEKPTPGEAVVEALDGMASRTSRGAKDLAT
jgi:DNA-binding response OmpR family regulator